MRRSHPLRRCVGRVMLGLGAAALLCLLPRLITEVRAGHPSRPIGDSRFFASVPFPGYPEGIVVDDSRVYVSGPAAFGVPGNFGPSAITVFDLKSGNQIRQIAIQGQTGPLNAISCIAKGDDDLLYVLDEQQGVLQLDLETGRQKVYSGPFYPVYHSAFNPPAPYLLNDLAFDKKGNLYVTDSFQATIWRVPPGGGAPQVWFQDARLDGPFGVNGARVDKKSRRLYVSTTFDGAGEGHVYSLPLVDHPQPGDLQLFHTYPAPSGPDGLAFGKSGNIYVALAGSSQISVLRPDGSQSALFSGPAQRPSGALPWTNPANIAFDNAQGRILVTNHASLTNLPDPSPLFAVFDVFVDDEEGRLFEGKD